MFSQHGKINIFENIIYNCFKILLLTKLSIWQREMQPLIMTTEELKFYCTGLIKADGLSEDLFFKIHNDGISKLLNTKIN